MTASSVQVSTSNYEFAHEHRPRGEGNWAFDFSRGTDWNRQEWFQGTYSEARRQAVRFAVEMGYYHVEVGS